MNIDISAWTGFQQRVLTTANFIYIFISLIERISLDNWAWLRVGLELAVNSNESRDDRGSQGGDIARNQEVKKSQGRGRGAGSQITRNITKISGKRGLRIGLATP